GITVIHLRESLRDGQFPWSKLFESYDPGVDVKADGFSTTTVTLKLGSRADSTKVTWQVLSNRRERIAFGDHAFLWFRVAIVTDQGPLQYDFKNIGLYH